MRSLSISAHCVACTSPTGEVNGHSCSECNLCQLSLSEECTGALCVLVASCLLFCCLSIATKSVKNGVHVLVRQTGQNGPKNHDQIYDGAEHEADRHLVETQACARDTDPLPGVSAQLGPQV